MIKSKKCRCWCKVMEASRSDIAEEYSGSLGIVLPSALGFLISWGFQVFTNKSSCVECYMCFEFSYVTPGVDVDLYYQECSYFVVYQTSFPSISIGLLRDHTVGDSSAIAESNSLAFQPSSATLNHPPALPLACSTILIASLEETYLQALPQPQTSDLASSTSNAAPLVPQHKQCHPMPVVRDSVDCCWVFISAEKIVIQEL